MRTNLCLFLTALLCSVGSFLAAQPVNINTAKAIAERHLSAISKPSLKSTLSKVKNFQFTSVKATVENNDTLYYILNDTINKGFVIVSADKRAWPILAYSTEGSLNEKKQPDAFTAWMESRKKEIEYIKQNNFQPNSATIDSWQNLSLKNATINSTSVEPLLKTKWGQGCYYNEICPSDGRSSGYCGHVPTGCVATAMAQIMKYWNYPTKGNSSNSYLSSNYGTIEADFSNTYYQWDQMPIDPLTSSNNALATLMYQCGVATFMGYSPYGSATTLRPKVLVDFFDYSPSIKFIDNNNYSSSQWADLLKSELDLGHPIYYSTDLPSGSSHALVCDGYQNSDYFHFNWGWEGSCDGYYYLNDIQTFNSHQTAIINIIPNHLPDNYVGLILSSNSLTINAKEGVSDPVRVKVASSSNWTATSNQSWLRLSSGTGTSGTSILNLHTTENSTSLDRIATVTITADGFPPQLITVKQFHKYEVTAGGLSKIQSNDLATITNLTLKGFIDARDFKTMRDLMPSLESVDLSEATIVAYSGREGTSLQNSIYPANTIPENAFIAPGNHTSTLTNFIFPVSTTAIGRLAFNSCFNLSSISLPPKLQSIADNAFDNCISLDSLHLPSSLLELGKQIFNGIIVSVDSGNPNYICIDGVLYNKSQTKLIYCPTSKKGNFNIPTTVKTIAFGAFTNCGQITSFTIPSSVDLIESLAFSCNALTSIKLPSSIIYIQDAAFFGSRNLTSFTVGSSVPSDLKASNDVFSTIDKNKCTLNVPYKTAALYRSAYQWNEFKNIVEAPSGFCIDSNEIKLTSSATETTSVSVKSNVTWTVSCDQPWLIVNPSSGSGDNTLKIVAQEKTSEGSRLAKITISTEGFENQIITVVQDGASIKLTAGNLKGKFTEEELLSQTSLKLSGTIDARDFKTMRDLMPRLKRIDLTDASIIGYTGTEGTSLRGNLIYPADVIPESAFNLSNNTNKNLGSIILPVSTKSIDDFAFRGCLGLNSVTLSKALLNIDSNAFTSCKNLEHIFIPETVELIYEQAFIECSALFEVDPNNRYFTSIDGVLYNKKQNTLIQCPISKTGNFIIPKTVTTIGREAFYSCSGITSITIPSTVTQINWLSFGFCSNLSSIVVNKLIPLDIPPANDPFWLIDKDVCILNVPYGSVSLYRTSNQWKDFKNIVEMPGFKLSATTANVKADQGSTCSIDISSNVSCYVNSNQSWLKASLSWTTGTSSITFEATENPEKVYRSAIVTVSAEGVESQTITITQEAKNTTGIDKPSKTSEFKVYPNPTTGKIKLVFRQIPLNGITVSIDDITGKNCLKLLINENEVWLDLSGNAPGIYFIKTDQENLKTQKVILK
jgi:hypothetical protein